VTAEQRVVIIPGDQAEEEIDGYAFEEDTQRLSRNKFPHNSAHAVILCANIAQNFCSKNHSRRPDCSSFTSSSVLVASHCCYSLLLAVATSQLQ